MTSRPISALTESGREACEFVARRHHQRLQSSIVEVGLARGRHEHAGLRRLHRAARMMHQRTDLPAQRPHVGRKARFDHLGRINSLLAEKTEALVEIAADGAQYLQIVGDARIVERKGHGPSPLVF